MLNGKYSGAIGEIVETMPGVELDEDKFIKEAATIPVTNNSDEYRMYHVFVHSSLANISPLKMNMVQSNISQLIESDINTFATNLGWGTSYQKAYAFYGEYAYYIIGINSSSTGYCRTYNTKTGSLIRSISFSIDITRAGNLTNASVYVDGTGVACFGYFSASTKYAICVRNYGANAFGIVFSNYGSYFKTINALRYGNYIYYVLRNTEEDSSGYFSYAIIGMDVSTGSPLFGSSSVAGSIRVYSGTACRPYRLSAGIQDNILFISILGTTSGGSSNDYSWAFGVATFTINSSTGMLTNNNTGSNCAIQRGSGTWTSSNGLGDFGIVFRPANSKYYIYEITPASSSSISITILEITSAKALRECVSTTVYAKIYSRSGTQPMMSKDDHLLTDEFDLYFDGTQLIYGAKQLLTYPSGYSQLPNNRFENLQYINTISGCLYRQFTYGYEGYTLASADRIVEVRDAGPRWLRIAL